MLGLLLKIDWSVMFSWPEFWAWAEVWALLIPLAVYLVRRKGFPRLLRPVLYYVLVALFLNFLSDFSWRMKIRLNLPPWASNNIPIYHLNFILRLLLFAWFFNLLNEPFLKNIKKILPWLFMVFVVILFTIIRPIKSFVFEYNSVLNAVEAAILLFYCLQHYVYLAQAEQIPYTHSRSVNWIVAGLTLYVGVNFFIFLSYSTLIKLSHDFSIVIWDVHNASYVILCCLIAKGFYESNRP